MSENSYQISSSNQWSIKRLLHTHRTPCNWKTYLSRTPFMAFEKYILVYCSVVVTLKCMQFIKPTDHSSNIYPSIAQLVERRTVVGLKQISLGHWFESGSKEIFLLLYKIKWNISVNFRDTIETIQD